MPVETLASMRGLLDNFHATIPTLMIGSAGLHRRLFGVAGDCVR